VIQQRVEQVLAATELGVVGEHVRARGVVPELDALLVLPLLPLRRLTDRDAVVGQDLSDLIQTQRVSDRGSDRG
jgi:hypothetical protein